MEAVKGAHPRLRVLSEPLPGLFLLASQSFEDERGRFARCFCREDLAEAGIDIAVVQANLSRSWRRGTFRGLHYQLPPVAETKIIHCVQGRIHDVVLDLRPGTFGRCFSVELSADNGRALVVPPGCAHGFLTLTDDVLILYFTSAPYDPFRERGIRYDDPNFLIPLPFAPEVISHRDRTHPDFDPAWHLEGKPCAWF